jgi:uncharacterized membrane protein required for colicin V production
VNLLDYVLLGVLGVFVLWGYFKGFLLQVFHLAGIAAAFVLAARFYVPLAESQVFAEVRGRSEASALVIAFLLVFFATAALASVLAGLIHKRLHRTELRSGDRWLGGLLGAAKGVLILGGAALGLQEWQFPAGVSLPAAKQVLGEGIVEKSVIVPRLAEACLTVVALIPPQGREKIRQFVEEQRRTFHLDAPAQPEANLRPNTTGDAVTPLPNSSEPPQVTGDAKRPVLDLITLRRLTLRESEGEARPTPASGPREEP